MNLPAKLLHIAYPQIDRLLPESGERRPIFGASSAPLRLVPVLAEGIAWWLLILFVNWLLGDALFRAVVLFKLPEIFRVEFLNPEFFHGIARTFRKAAMLALFLWFSYRTLEVLGRHAFAVGSELFLIRRLPLAVRVTRIPFSRIRAVTFDQYPGERLFGSGEITLHWEGDGSLRLPTVLGVEEKVEFLARKIRGRSGGGPRRGRKPHGQERSPSARP